MNTSSKPTIRHRFFVWLLSMVAGFVVKRIMKRLTATTHQTKPAKQGRKYVKNKAD